MPVVYTFTFSCRCWRCLLCCNFLPLVLWLTSLPPLPLLLPPPPFLLSPPSPLLPSLVASLSTLLLRVTSTRVYWKCSSPLSRGCACFFMAGGTDIVIKSFTSFTHSIAAFALLKPFLAYFVLPVRLHTFSIPYFSS